MYRVGRCTHISRIRIRRNGSCSGISMRLILVKQSSRHLLTERLIQKIVYDCAHDEPFETMQGESRASISLPANRSHTRSASAHPAAAAGARGREKCAAIKSDNSSHVNCCEHIARRHMYRVISPIKLICEQSQEQSTVIVN